MVGKKKDRACATASGVHAGCSHSCWWASRSLWNPDLLLAADPHQQSGGSVTAVVRAGGASLFDKIDGTAIGALKTATLVRAVARDADVNWLLIETPAGLSGWTPVDGLIFVGAQRLPLHDDTVQGANGSPSKIEPVGAAKPASILVPTSTPAPQTQQPDDDADSATELSAGTSITARVNLTDARLNVRSGPGVEFRIVGRLMPESSTSLAARTESGEWLLVDAGDVVGWVNANYIEPEDALEGLPVQSGPASKDGSTTATQPTAVAPQAGHEVGARSAGLAGRLVIQSERGGQIWVYQLATGRLYPLTTGFDPAISPDGRQVAFTHGGGEAGIYVVDIDGGDERLIFGERPELYAPKWSPDGRRLLFVRGDEWIDCFVLPDGRCMVLEWLRKNRPNLDRGRLEQKQERLYKLTMIDANGDNFTDLPALETAGAPDWSVDGIVYASKAGLQAIAPDATTENASTLVYFDILKQYHQDPDWRPGGGPILFQQREASHWEIYRINPDGGGRTALTRPATTLVDVLPSNVAPAWSPDGRHIVFLSNRTTDNSAGTWAVWVMNADGSSQHPLPLSLPIEYGFAGEQVVDWGP